jgi:hypothetical protein
VIGAQPFVHAWLPPRQTGSDNQYLQ